MITNDGLARIRTLVEDDLSHGQAGTGDTAPAFLDSALKSPVTATNVALTDSFVSGENVQATHSISTSLGNSSTLTEWEVRGNSNVTSYNRVLRNGLLKNSTHQFDMIHTFTIKRPQT